MINTRKLIRLNKVFGKVVDDAFWVFLGSLFLALCAQFRVPLPFTPIPLTLQTLGVMLIAAFLGKEKAIGSVVLYLVQGGCGAPVWSGGGTDGFFRIMGPAGGYLMAYPLLAWMIGCSVQKYANRMAFMSVAFFGSVCVQLLIGSFWLGRFIGFERAFFVGFCPFLLGDFFKALFVVGVLKFKLSRS